MNARIGRRIDYCKKGLRFTTLQAREPVELGTMSYDRAGGMLTLWLRFEDGTSQLLEVQPGDLLELAHRGIRLVDGKVTP